MKGFLEPLMTLIVTDLEKGDPDGIPRGSIQFFSSKRVSRNTKFIRRGLGKSRPEAAIHL